MRSPCAAMYDQIPEHLPEKISSGCCADIHLPPQGSRWCTISFKAVRMFSRRPAARVLTVFCLEKGMAPAPHGRCDCQMRVLFRKFGQHCLDEFPATVDGRCVSVVSSARQSMHRADTIHERPAPGAARAATPITVVQREPLQLPDAVAGHDAAAESTRVPIQLHQQPRTALRDGHSAAAAAVAAAAVATSPEIEGPGALAMSLLDFELQTRVIAVVKAFRVLPLELAGRCARTSSAAPRAGCKQ